VRKLKQDIWSHLDEQLLNPDDGNQENVRPNADISAAKKTMTKDSHTQPQENMSFRSMLHDLSKSQSQKEATLPFYFICLLHLANEKVHFITHAIYMHFLKSNDNASRFLRLRILVDVT
jgi:hypothetical protein